jgi:hypothetical protein
MVQHQHNVAPQRIQRMAEQIIARVFHPPHRIDDNAARTH